MPTLTITPFVNARPLGRCRYAMTFAKKLDLREIFIDFREVASERFSDNSLSTQQLVEYLEAIRINFCDTPSLKDRGLCSSVIAKFDGEDLYPCIKLEAPKTKYFRKFDPKTITDSFENWMCSFELEDIFDSVNTYEYPQWSELSKAAKQ